MSFTDVKESALNWELRFKFCSWFFSNLDVYYRGEPLYPSTLHFCYTVG